MNGNLRADFQRELPGENPARPSVSGQPLSNSRNGEAKKPSRPPNEPFWGLQLLLRRLLLAVIFASAIGVCRWLSYQLRFDFSVPAEYQPQLTRDLWWVLCLNLGWLLVFRQFSGIYRYFSIPDLRYLAYAMLCSGLSLYFIGEWVDSRYSTPRSVLAIQCELGFLALGGMRAGWRVLLDRNSSRRDRRCMNTRRVAVIGAGDAGSSLIRDLAARPQLGLVPVVVFDDDPKKWHSRVHGVRVVGAPETLRKWQARLRIQGAIIAMPSASPKRIGEVVASLQAAGLEHVTVPSIVQLASGAVRISQLRPVRIEDLLGREPVNLRLDEIRNVLEGRRVCVTGAGGSIGSELCRQVAAFQPAQLLLVEQSEVQLFQLEQELLRLGHQEIIEPLVADILDGPRMSAILGRYRPEIIFHAAAHKHVPMMERQPAEAIKNNTFGTVSLAELSLRFEVARFVMVSTDKAVNPTSVMGASKRLAEVFLQSFAQQHPGQTRFVAVRFGNVLGSSGSVVPTFERQIAEGGPITVTHPEMVRYFMTIPEAVGLILQSCALGQGGEIFVLDMGHPVRIADLAQQMIRLSGLEPGRDIEIKFVGLRPGEKLFEELKHLKAFCTDTAHPRIKRLTSPPRRLEEVRAQLEQFNGRLHSAPHDELKEMLRSFLPEYKPYRSGNGDAGEGRPSVQTPPGSAPDVVFHGPDVGDRLHRYNPPRTEPVKVEVASSSDAAQLRLRVSNERRS
ncbi:MAG TPA: nucleoside-diphosphate sugar epimerase/dehydratase [Verrucomicrobiae bacterium]|nr:nucleoside-diphosphate sugar epimerase/dehydratase [Verrucomicrobiae bacterium]